MRTASRIAISVTLAAALMTSVGACSLIPLMTPPASSPTDSEDTGDASEAALAKYVEAERSQIPTIIEQYPDLYSDVTIDGAVEESTGDDEIPAGTHSVVRFTYTYADAMDWDATSTALDGQTSALDDACSATIFTAMGVYGVEGPLAAVFGYTDATSGDEIMWSHTCSE